ncbi:hypothetical protein PQI51_03155 [Microbacterium esteraromaticum]
MVKQPMVVRNIRVPAHLWDEAKTAAEQNDETISDVVRRALTDYVEKNR